MDRRSGYDRHVTFPCGGKSTLYLTGYNIRIILDSSKLSNPQTLLLVMDIAVMKDRLRSRWK